MSFTTGWTREYILDKLTFPALMRYYEYSEEYLADISQMIAVEVGLVFGVVKKATPQSKDFCDGVNCSDDGVSSLILKNL